MKLKKCLSSQLIENRLNFCFIFFFSDDKPEDEQYEFYLDLLTSPNESFGEIGNYWQFNTIYMFYLKMFIMSVV